MERFKDIVEFDKWNKLLRKKVEKLQNKEKVRKEQYILIWQGIVVDVEREGNMGNAQVCQEMNTANAHSLAVNVHFNTANAYSSAATALSPRS